MNVPAQIEAMGLTFPAPRRVVPCPIREITIFAIVARDFADFVATDNLAFLDAVDLAYEYAVDVGLVDAVGDDVVQTILAVAFENARPT
jgi:hypothetical protein